MYVLVVTDQAAANRNTEVETYNFRHQGVQCYRQQQLREVLPASEGRSNLLASVYPAAVL